MFTGIIKAKGTIQAMDKRGGDVRLAVRSDGLPWGDYEVGESIAVNGVCLTAVALHDDGFDTDVSVETLDVTALGGLAAGAMFCRFRLRDDGCLARFTPSVSRRAVPDA